jgi:hypothetical protein
VFAVAAGAAVVVDAAAGVAESADVDFFERLDFFGAAADESVLAAVFAVEAEDASVVEDFLDLEELFLGAEAVEAELSAAVAESADSDFFERLLDFGLEAVSEAAAEFESAAEESALFDFDLDFGLEVPAADESDAAVLED